MEGTTVSEAELNSQNSSQKVPVDTDKRVPMRRWIQDNLEQMQHELRSGLREDVAALLREDREAVSGQGITEEESRLGPPDEAGQREARAPNYIPDTPKIGAVLVEQGGEEDPTSESTDDLKIPFAQHVRAAAGPGEAVFEEAADFGIAINRSVLPGWVCPGGLICIRATGDSMEPTLYEDDLILTGPLTDRASGQGDVRRS